MAAGSNVPELSVSELAFSLKRTLEETYGRIKVRGELSKVKIHTSGHMYSDLKDADSVINVVCWRTSLGKLAVRPEEGLEVVCTGRITTYPARSNYQLVIEQMELAGQGALLKMLEDRKKRLAAEGLFDDSRKRALPYLPRVIGVVTSPTGAVIRDIIHRLDDRFPVRVLVWPVKVQGEGAAEEIAAAIRGFSNLTPSASLPRPDLVIVARGGGSLEDLMPFNEECVVRAAAECSIPLISAVGHETDTTLIDFAADRRAPTPTAAAEMAVPERLGLVQFVQDCSTRLTTSLRRLIAENRQIVATYAAKLGDPRRLLELQTQKFDHVADRLSGSLQATIHVKRHDLLKIAARLPHPQTRLDQAQQGLNFHSQQLSKLRTKLTQEPRRKLELAAQLLEVLSFKGTLKRGFAVVRSADGVVTQISQTNPGLGLEIELSDGTFKSRVE